MVVEVVVGSVRPSVCVCACRQRRVSREQDDMSGGRRLCQPKLVFLLSMSSRPSLLPSADTILSRFVFFEQKMLNC